MKRKLNNHCKKETQKNTYDNDTLHELKRALKL